MNWNKIPFFSFALLLVGCQADEPQPTQQQAGTLTITTSVDDFEGRGGTRTNIGDNAFEDGDKIKLKMICPYSTHTEFGETTYSGSFDGFWLLKWDADKWALLTAADGYDINGDYAPSAAPNIFERYLAQQTPYVFTAQTWTDEQMFMAGSGTRVMQYSNVFHANQTHEADYKASDLMWAQTIMQTGTYNVHLSFKHVMAALCITVDGVNLSDKAVLTLEGMPDIDQAEVIVGDCYADKSKVNSNTYGYQMKHACDADQNGKVIGVAVVSDDLQKTYTKALSEIGQTATYTAYDAGSQTYRLIVPPCELKNKATLWLRDGELRYSMPLSQQQFEAGKRYSMKMTIK